MPLRFTIATKLFLGFLCVIGLNAAYFVIVKRIENANTMVEILKRENDVKTLLLRLKTLHRIQGPSVISYEKIGLRESVENFRSINRNIKMLIDTIVRDLDSISRIDPVHQIMPKNGQDTGLPIMSGMVAMIHAVTLNNNKYASLFDSLVDSRINKSAGVDENARTVMLDTVERAVAAGIDSAELRIGRLSEICILDISSTISEAKKVTMFIVFIVTVFSLVFGLIFSRTITNSLRRLKESAALIGKADFDIDQRGFRNDEIGDLAAAFFNMAVDLRSKQDELIKSKRLAAIGEVVASVNHEINNPLMIISGNAQFLEMSMDGYPDEMKERVQAILEETRRISQVTRKLREIKNPVSEDYTSGGGHMIDLNKSL
jgi:phosphoglycerate-specific signal transduction histidine kinase